MKGTLVLAMAVMAGLLVFSVRADDVEKAKAALRVGIYLNPIPGQYTESSGFEGMKIALEDDGFEKVTHVKDLDPEKLKDIDVLLISSVKNYPKDWDLKQVKEWQRQFVESGKGLVLFHESVGWRAPAFRNDPPFPEFGRGVGLGAKGDFWAPVQRTDMIPSVRDHPITKGLPESFQMQYDTAPMLPGPKGKVLVVLKRDAIVRGADYKLDRDYAALIVGELGKGRLVLFGPLAGQALKPREMEKAPTDGELQMLINSVLWAGKKI